MTAPHISRMKGSWVTSFPLFYAVLEIGWLKQKTDMDAINPHALSVLVKPPLQGGETLTGLVSTRFCTIFERTHLA